MANFEHLIKQARDCRTKAAWEKFFAEYGDHVASTSHSRLLLELFRLLKTDPQSQQYAATIWGQLLRGCLSSWNLELGHEIAVFTKKIAASVIQIPAAQLYLERGQPATTREIAHRALRLVNISDTERLQLELLVCSSYVEENRRRKAIRLLANIELALEQRSLDLPDKASSLASIARMHFYLGRYVQAGRLFEETANIYRETGDEELLARAIFNTAASYLNGGTENKAAAFAMVEECRRLAESLQLNGHLAHCEAIYGIDAYYTGNFAAAKEHLRRGLEYLPNADKGFRRLHILSMLAYTYLAMGRFHLARKFGQRTLDLAAMDSSEKYATKYSTLEATLLWEDGEIEASQTMLQNSTAHLETSGVNTLEEINTLSRLNLQSALLGQTKISRRFVVDKSLRKNFHIWMDREYSLGQLFLNTDKLGEAESHFNKCLSQSKNHNDLLHEAMALLGLVQLALRRNSEKTTQLIRDFSITVARLGETPLKAQVPIVHAAAAYRQGDFPECQRLLVQAAQSPRQCFADKFVLTTTLATLEGHSPRLRNSWQFDMVARFVKTYFTPSIEALDDNHFCVSNHYTISLERHQALADVLRHLMSKNGFHASPSEIQSQVWQQSLRSQGWQQKIRNTITRLRDFFPHTIAPLIVYGDEIRLFSQAINIIPIRPTGLDTSEEVCQLLGEAPMSSSQLSERLSISVATTKRILKRLTEEEKITTRREGRRVYYSRSEGSP